MVAQGGGVRHRAELLRQVRVEGARGDDAPVAGVVDVRQVAVLQLVQRRLVPVLVVEQLLTLVGDGVLWRTKRHR